MPKRQSSFRLTRPLTFCRSCSPDVSDGMHMCLSSFLNVNGREIRVNLSIVIHAVGRSVMPALPVIYASLHFKSMRFEK